MEKVILAFSGGLDTSVCVKLLEKKYNLEVITACVDVGQDPEEIEHSREISEKISDGEHYTIDVKEEFAENFLFKAIKANAIYEGYALSTALARPLIAIKIVELAKKENASVIAHGCTGKGNDQFRFESMIRSLSDCDVVAPIRELNLTRSEEVEYAKEHNIPLSEGKQYSIDENIWGRSVEGDILENIDIEPPEDIYNWTSSIEDTPNKAQIVEIVFNDGVPVSIDDKKLTPLELIRKSNELAGRHGIGRIDLIEDRIIGLKSREIYETPGALLIINTHKALENLVLTRSEIKFKEIISNQYAELVYNGMWHDPLREDLDKIIDHMQSRVNGLIRVKLHKGTMKIIGRGSECSLYNEDAISFEDKDMDQREMVGMVKNYGLQAAIYNKLKK